MARRGRKLTIAWAAEDDASSLYRRYRREGRADVRPRLHALWLVRTGHTARETAGVLAPTVNIVASGSLNSSCHEVSFSVGTDGSISMSLKVSCSQGVEASAQRAY